MVAPYGADDEVRPSRPIIRLKNITGTGICRRYPFTIRQARENLEESGLKQEFIDEFFGEQESESEERSNNDPVRTNVEGNWLKFGLWIANKNNFYLVIDSLIYNATAIHKGQSFSHTGTIESSYCDNSPFLYFIPPNHKAPYEPFSRNPLRNLTVFISGFPIIDRSNQPSYNQQQRTQNVGRQFGIQGFGQEAGSNQQGAATGGTQFGGQQGLGGQQQNQVYGPNEIIVIPDYTVELTLRGYFMTKSGIPISDFVKRTRFLTQSSL